MAQSLPLESTMEDIFVKKAPPLPAGGKKAIVSWSPWIALVVGVLTLLSALTIWHWAHAVNDAASYVNALCNAYAGDSVAACHNTAVSRLSFWLWLTLIVLIVEAVLYLLAFPGLRDRKKQGWNYLYYGALVNVVYAVVSLFTEYDRVGHFIGALIGSAIGFYFLFQIRASYTGAKATAAPKDPVA